MSPVSVVIPTYNHARFLRQAIDSALGQTLPPREVIVIDDGSSDGTPDIVAEYGHRIRAVRHTNRGVAATRNAGAALATGELLAFLDADDVWLPRKLELQVEQFRRDVDLGFAHCGVEEIDGHGSVLRRIVCGQDQDVARELLMFRRPVILGGGSGVLIRATCFHELGGFDQNLSTSADWDLYFRLANKYSVRFIPEVLLQYRQHESNMHSNIDAMERDMLYAYAKVFAQPTADIACMRRLAYGCLHAALAGSFFATGQWPKAIRHAVRSLMITPENTTRVLGWPLRRFLRRRASKDKV